MAPPDTTGTKRVADLIKSASQTFAHIVLELFPLFAGVTLKIIFGEHDVNKAVMGFRKICASPSEQNIKSALDMFTKHCRSDDMHISFATSNFDYGSYIKEYWGKDLWLDMLVIAATIMIGLRNNK